MLGRRVLDGDIFLEGLGGPKLLGVEPEYFGCPQGFLEELEALAVQGVEALGDLMVDFALNTRWLTLNSFI